MNWTRIRLFIAAVRKFIRRRVRLFLYFLILIIVAGNLGTLIALAQWFWSKEGVTGIDVVRCLVTYAIAIAAISFADCFLHHDEEQDDNRTALLILFGILIGAVGSAVIVLFVDSPVPIRNWTIATCLLTGTLWFAANVHNPKLVQPDAYDALGGENPV